MGGKRHPNPRVLATTPRQKSCGRLKKNRLGDYRVEITSNATNQPRECSIITYVIKLILDYHSWLEKSNPRP